VKKGSAVLQGTSTGKMAKQHFCAVISASQSDPLYVEDVTGRRPPSRAGMQTYDPGYADDVFVATTAHT